MKPGDKLRITHASAAWRLRHGPRVATVTALSPGMAQVHWNGATRWYSVRGARLVIDGEWLAFTPYSDSV